MRTQQPFPSWESVLFRGAQLARLPRNEDEPVNTRTVLGRSAAKPLAIAMPFYVSHMSFGALSREAKIALARGSRMAGTLICSGEGGLLPEERAEAALYIYELGTATFSHRDDAIRQADAVEIKIGQAAKPGLGGHLPAEKVTEEIARVRGIPAGHDSVSPGRFSGINTKGDLKTVAERVRGLLDGKPLGVLANYSQHYFGTAPVSADYFGLFCKHLAAKLGQQGDGLGHAPPACPYAKGGGLPPKAAPFERVVADPPGA